LLATSLYQAFLRPKERCYEMLEEVGSAKATLAWLQSAVEEERSIFGDDWWAYGVDANRESLEALLEFSHEQGLSSRRLTIDELFAPSTLKPIPLGEGQLI